MDLKDELERSFAGEPAHRPVEERIAAGRRLVRRRRAVAGVVALAAVGGIGAAYGAVGGEPAAEPGYTDRTEDAEPGPDRALLDESQVAVGPDGELLTAPGVEIVEQVPNPGGYGDPGAAYGVAYRSGGTLSWALVDRGGGTYQEAFRAFPTFELWLDDQVALQRGRPTLQLVEFAGGERLQPLSGVDLLAQTAEIAPIEGFAKAGDPTAVAEVSYDGRRWYVVARDLDDAPPEYFPAAASVTRPTLAEFVAWLEADPWHFDSLR